MNLEQRLNGLAVSIGADIKALKLADGDLTALNTSAKNNLVAALNEVLAIAGAGVGIIDDSAGDGVANKAWSADKIFDHVLASINALRTELLGGATAALDTFGELAAQMAADESAAAALATQVANRVRFDAAQTLTAQQKQTARDNIGAADAAALTTLSTSIGNADVDLVAAYTAAKA